MTVQPGTTVKYQVSDFLKDRHPYQVEAGFATQRDRDAGRAFNGFQPAGLDQLINYLVDESIEQPEKAVALRHLLALSAAAEKKIVLLRKQVVPQLAALMMNSPIPSVESHCAQLLRSLCILPQGSHAVVTQGGLQALSVSIANRENAAAREEARTFSVGVLQQIASNWDGRSWLLGEECSQELALLGSEPIDIPQEQRDALAQSVCDVLVSVVERDSETPRMLLLGLHALALMTTAPRGLQLALIAGVLRATSELLEKFIKNDLWAHQDSTIEAETVLHGVTVVWHMAMDSLGQKEAMNLPFVNTFGKIIAFVLPVKDRLFQLKSALAGAVAALALHPPMKIASLEKVATVGGEPVSLLDLVLSLVVQGHEVYQPMHAARKTGQSNPTPGIRIEDVSGVIKNAVQAVRLIAELPKAREYLKEKVSPDQVTLRRQLFYLTNFMEEFGVQMV